ncbi:MAG: DUF2793 domain-containing protein [Hyphomicrobiaceae bacterium]
MDQTPNLALPYILAAQAQKHVTHNEAIRALDAMTQIGVVSRSITVPPASPAEGDCYLTPPAATGAWAGTAGRLAAFQDGAWMFFAPRDGWIAWIADEAAAVVYAGSSWTLLIAALPTLGVNATADTTNRLAVSASATLLNHDGSGHQLKVNKATAGATASLLYQTNFSGRAEMGTTGDDDFHVKVSADGTTWRDAMLISAATGKASFPAGGIVTSTASTVTIAVPSQAATIQAALDQLMSLRFEGSAQGIVLVANGTYVLASPLSCRHPQSARIAVKAATAATLPLEADFTAVKATDEAMVRAKYKVIVECPNMSGWTAADGEGVAAVQDMAFIRTGTTGTPVGVSATRRGAVVLDRCALFGFTRHVEAREQGSVRATNCQFAHAGASAVSVQLGGYAVLNATLIQTAAGNGIEVGHSQFCSESGLRIKAAAAAGLALTNGSRALISGATLTGNAGSAVSMQHGSKLEAASCALSGGTGQVALNALDGCAINLSAVTASGDATQRTFQAQRASVLSTSGSHTGTPVFSPAAGTTGNNGSWTF